MRIRVLAMVAVLFSAGAASAQSGTINSAASPFDLVIVHGHIVDGTGSPWYSGDVGIRGVLKKGMWADVVVFDPATIRDLATFEQPNQLSQGMEFVLVNGVPVIADGRNTGSLPGKVLRGPGYVRK